MGQERRDFETNVTDKDNGGPERPDEFPSHPPVLCSFRGLPRTELGRETTFWCLGLLSSHYHRNIW